MYQTLTTNETADWEIWPIRVKFEGDNVAPTPSYVLIFTNKSSILILQSEGKAFNILLLLVRTKVGEIKNENSIPL